MSAFSVATDNGIVVVTFDLRASRSTS
jgi:hypothetical protein